MLFNSWQFAVFMLVVGPAYVLLQRWLRLQNLLLVVASYYFYGSWDYRFLLLLMATTCMDFFIMQRLWAAEGQQRKRWLLLSVGVNLSILGFFKYYGFFVESMVALLGSMNVRVSPPMLHIVLPVGISFYTFQAISYTVEVYKGRLEPCRNLIDFAAFTSFFPQLVAGPIERATHLLPQICAPRQLSWAQVDQGLALVVQGLVKKIVVADNLAQIANPIFNDPTKQAPADLLCGALAFTFQIYGDFSGYTDIARGVARGLGFDLSLNFKIPYASRNPSEFWQRWHVSLSSWLRDYLYIPLGGNRGSEAKTSRNLVLTMLLGGLWHGAAWHFVAWGAYHGALLVLYRRLSPYLGWVPRSVAIVGGWALMFCFTVEGWILFRADTFANAWYMTSHLGFAGSDQTAKLFADLLFFTAPILLLDAYLWLKNDLLGLVRLPVVVREVVYVGAVCLMILFAVRTPTEFIYFQF